MLSLSDPSFLVLWLLMMSQSSSAKKKYSRQCAGTSLLFTFDRTSYKLEQFSISKRIKFESLHLSPTKVLLLENHNVFGNHKGTGVFLLCVYSINSGKSWNLGVVLFQTMHKVAITKVLIDEEVSCTFAMN